MIATIAKDLPNFILFRLGMVKITYWQMAASTFLPVHDTSTSAGLIIGAAADIILGGGLGMIIVLIFQKFGFDLWWYKGICAGNIIWLFASGIGVNLFTRLVPLDPFFRVSSLVEHQIYGLVAAFFIQHWLNVVNDYR